MEKESSLPDLKPKITKRRLLPAFGIFFGFILLLIFILFAFAFYLTTDSGIRKWGLPGISKFLGIEIAASRVEWNPASSIKILDLCVGPKSQPIFQAKEIAVQYNGHEFIHGNYQIQKITLDSVNIHFTEHLNGTPAYPPTEPKAPPQQTTFQTQHPLSFQENRSFLPQLSISTIDIKNLEFTYVSPKSTRTIHDLQLEIHNLNPGKSPLSLKMQAGFNVQENSKKSHAFAGRIKSELNLDLDKNLILRAAKGTISVSDFTGHVAGESLDGLSIAAQIDLTSSNGTGILKEARLSIQKNNSLTTLFAIGPFDLARKEADLEIQIGPIHSDILNMLFADKKIDFRDSSLSYVGHLNLAKGGLELVADGKLEANPFNMISRDFPNNTWKSILLTAEHSIKIDWAQQNAWITKLNIDASRDQKPIIKGILNKPMSISWGKISTSDHSASEADFNLQIFPSDLFIVSPLLGLLHEFKLSSGTLESNLKVTASEGGHNLTLDGHIGITHLALTSPHLSLEDAALSLDGKVYLKNLQSTQFTSLSIKLSEKGNPIGTILGNGNLEISNWTGHGIYQLDVSLPNFLALKPIANLKILSGSISGKMEWNLLKEDHFTCKTNLAARDLDFQYQKVQYHQTAFNFDGNIEWISSMLKLDSARLTAFIANQPAGSWQGNLSWNKNTNDLSSSFQLEGWKEPIFSPVFIAWLPEKKLRSIELTAQGELKFEKETLDLKSSATVKNLFVETPGIASLKPLNATLSTNLRYHTDGTLILQSLALQLDQTPTAKNLFQISGVIKQSPNAFSTDLKCQGYSLDLTSYYDQLFPSLKSNPPSGPSSSPSIPVNTISNTTPTVSSPMPQSVLHDIKLLISINSLKIHDFVLTDLNIPLKQNGNIIELIDGYLKIGGTPVTASITTNHGSSNPAFRFEAKTEGLNIAPLIDIIEPELKGQVGGLLTVKTYGTGTGISQNDLEKSLEGNIEVTVRQAHLEQLPSIEKSLKQLGEILQSPKIIDSTVNDIEGSGKISNGKLHTDNLHVKGSTVETTIRGDVFLNQQLSLEADLKLQQAAVNESALLRPLLQLISHEQDQWTQIPGGAKINGTLTDPHLAIDTSKIATDTIMNTGINYIKDLLKPKKSDAQKGNPSPQQPQEENPIQNLLDGFFKKKNKQ